MHKMENQNRGLQFPVRFISKNNCYLKLGTFSFQQYNTQKSFQQFKNCKKLSNKR